MWACEAAGFCLIAVFYAAIKIFFNAMYIVYQYDFIS